MARLERPISLGMRIVERLRAGNLNIPPCLTGVGRPAACPLAPWPYIGV